MAEATINTRTPANTEAKTLAARRYYINFHSLTPDEARETWTTFGDSAALVLFESLSPEAQARRMAEFDQQTRVEADQLTRWLESIDRGGWPCASEIQEQMLQDQAQEDAAKAEAELDPAWVKLMEQGAKKEEKQAKARQTSKKARKRAEKAKARSNSEPQAAAPVVTPATPATSLASDVAPPAPAPVEAKPVEDETPKVESEATTAAPIEQPLEVQLAELKAKPDAHKREVKKQIKVIEAAIRDQKHAAARAARQVEIRAQKAAEQLEKKRQRNAERFGMACSKCGFGLKERNRFVPPIDEMDADLGRPTRADELEQFVTCGRCAEDEDYPLAATQRVLAKRDIRRAEKLERQRVIEADMQARAAAEAAERQTQAELKARRAMLRLKGRGRYTHGPIRNAEGRRL